MTRPVVVVDPAVTRELRRTVLRPNLTAADPMPGDDLPHAVHLAVLADDGRPLCTCFVYEDPCPWRPGERAVHLRQMATAPAARGAGHGRAVVAAAIRHAGEIGVAVLWCNARETAAGFYERCGLRRHGEVFTDEHHPIPHVRMWLEVPASPLP